LFVLLFILIKMQKSLRSTIRERDRTVAERNRALADTRDLVTSIPGGWFITDAAGTILDTNTQFQEMTGRTAIQRPNILDIVSADQHIVFTAKMQASRDLEVMLNLRHTDGSEHLTIFKRRPLAGGDGVRDDQRDVWIALDTQRTDDLVVDRFLQHIAHTLKSPVHSLTLLSDRISESTDPKEQEHDRWLFKNELHRFETRMKTLWVLSDLETGKLRASPRRTSLVKMLYDTIRGFIPLAEQHGIALRQELARTKLPRRVVTDQNIVFVVLSNLLDNALKYTPQGGTVWVHALPGEGGGWWRLIVRDTGYGMAKAEIDNVFVRGARSLRDEIKKQEGFGLGMYVVHRLTTEYLQGRIAVASPGEGRGTTITVDLPFSPAGT
ncbi:MAG: HAMP domain-containing histidine kinase, partial [Deltaproteobacteria bacterium]|nr:HAMP domain-containing histidine kinase [Deltaproteobacteria bacterium]